MILSIEACFHLCWSHLWPLQSIWRKVGKKGLKQNSCAFHLRRDLNVKFFLRIGNWLRARKGFDLVLLHEWNSDYWFKKEQVRVKAEFTQWCTQSMAAGALVQCTECSVLCLKEGSWLWLDCCFFDQPLLWAWTVMRWCDDRAASKWSWVDLRLGSRGCGCFGSTWRWSSQTL